MVFEYLGFATAAHFLFHLLSYLYKLFIKSPLNITKLGSWALVTGATDGIGKAYAVALADKGMNIVLVSRSQDKLNKVEKEISDRYNNNNDNNNDTDDNNDYNNNDSSNNNNDSSSNNNDYNNNDHSNNNNDYNNNDTDDNNNYNNNDRSNNNHDNNNRFKVKTKSVVVDFARNSPAEYVPRLEKELKCLEIGLLVNNVGMTHDCPAPFLDIDGGAAMVQNLIDVNLISLNTMTRLVLPQMVARKKGAIVNIGSMAAYIPCALYSVYAATKAYMNKLTEILDVEYGRHGIVFQCVNPGSVVTNMNTKGGSSKPSVMDPSAEDFAKSALRRLGVFDNTTGYWAHDMMLCFVTFLPDWVVRKMIYGQISAERENVLERKKEEEKKAKEQ